MMLVLQPKSTVCKHKRFKQQKLELACTVSGMLGP